MKSILRATKYLLGSNEPILGWWDDWLMVTSTNDGIGWQTSFFSWWKVDWSSPKRQEPNPWHLGYGGLGGGPSTSTVEKVRNEAGWILPLLQESNRSWSNCKRL